MILLPFTLVVLLAETPPSVGGAGADPALTESTAARLARLALDCVQREYPSKISHVLEFDADARPPRALTPSFYGCFDWHSAVHAHWLLARLARTFPSAAFAAAARESLARSLTPGRIALEVEYLARRSRATFERPYGLAWLLQLGAELRGWDDAAAKRWSAALAPLEELAAERLTTWLPKLSRPVRVGEHDQTAFALGLLIDWARGAGRSETASLAEARSRDYFALDRGCPLAYEPSGQDFLSPCLAEADLMRRVMSPAAFAAWLGGFLPQIPLDGRGDWLAPAVVTDPSDGKLAHLDGLNLSRAWMIQGIASGLPEGDPRLPSLRAAAKRHAEAGLLAVTGEHYEGGHWLGTFAVYLLTGRGLGPPH